MKLRALVAVTIFENKFAVGTETGLPWSCPEDLKDFRTKTLGKICIVSLKTLVTIPNALVGRTVIALSSDPTKYEFDLSQNPHLYVVTDKEAVLKLVEDIKSRDQQVYVIGGPQIYKLFEDEIIEADVSLIADTYVNALPTVFMDRLPDDGINIRQYK